MVDEENDDTNADAIFQVIQTQKPSLPPSSPSGKAKARSDGLSPKEAKSNADKARLSLIKAYNGVAPSTITEFTGVQDTMLRKRSDVQKRRLKIGHTFRSRDILELRVMEELALRATKEELCPARVKDANMVRYRVIGEYYSSNLYCKIHINHTNSFLTFRILKNSRTEFPCSCGVYCRCWVDCN